MNLAPGLNLTKFALPGGVNGNGVRLTRFTLQKQDLASWCWAAVAVGVHQFYTGDASSQCTLATKILPGPPATCCQPGAHQGDPQCDRTFNTGAALQNHWAPPSVNGSVPFQRIQAEIQNQEGRPLACTLQGDGNVAGAHEVAISGWAEVQAGPGEAGKFVYFHDPIAAGEEGWISYSSLVHEDQVNWVTTYFTKAV